MRTINEDYQDEYSSNIRRSQKNKNLYQSLDNILWNNINQSSKTRCKTKEFDVSRLDRIIKDYEEYKERQKVLTRTERHIQSEFEKNNKENSFDYTNNTLNSIENKIYNVSNVSNKYNINDQGNASYKNININDKDIINSYNIIDSCDKIKEEKIKELFNSKPKKRVLSKKEFTLINETEIDRTRKSNIKIKIASGIIFVINTITIILLVIKLANK